MPVFLEPGQKFPIVLESDESKPAEIRPTFFAKSQSMRGQEQVLAVLDRLTGDDDVTPKQLFDDVCETLGKVLVGWSNMSGIEYTPEAIRDVLSYTEARELLRKVAYNSHVQPEEKKS